MAHLLAGAIHRTYDVCLPSVSELRPLANVWRFRGKVLRRFMHFTLTGETLDFILADSKGDRIHATVLPCDVDFFSTRFSEDDWILLVDFDLLPVGKEFRPTKHPFMIRLRRDTYCSKVYSRELSSFFSFVDLEMVLNEALDTSYCIDLIGKVISVGNFSDQANLFGMSQQKVTRFFLENNRGCRLSCYLTGHYDETFIGAFECSGEGIVVCVLRFAKIVVRGGTFFATSIYDCTQVLLNPPIPDVAAFKESRPVLEFSSY